MLPSTQIYATQSTTDWEQNYSIIDLPIMPKETDRGISVGKGGPQGRERHWWLFTGQGCTAGGAMCALCRTDPLLWHAHHLTNTTTCMHTFSLYINLIWWTRVKRYTVNKNIGFKISLFIHFLGSLMGSLYLFMCRGTWVLPVPPNDVMKQKSDHCNINWLCLRVVWSTHRPSFLTNTNYTHELVTCESRRRRVMSR